MENYEELYKLEVAKGEEIDSKLMDFGNALANKFSSRLKTILSKHCNEFGCKLLISPGYINIGYKNENPGISFRCEIGFQKPDDEEGKMEFGSSFSFHYEDGKIFVNCGTCGEYGLDDKFQLARNSIIYHLTCVYGKQIESFFNNISGAEEYIFLWEASCEQQRNIASAKNKLNEYKYKLIEDQLKVGIKFCFVKGKREPFSSLSYYDWYKDEFTIIKVTPKYIFMDVKSMESTSAYKRNAKFKKSDVIYRLKNGSLTIINDNNEEV